MRLRCSYCRREIRQKLHLRSFEVLDASGRLLNVWDTGNRYHAYCFYRKWREASITGSFPQDGTPCPICGKSDPGLAIVVVVCGCKEERSAPTRFHLSCLRDLCGKPGALELLLLMGGRR
jgi:hypothetical protein